MEVTSLTSLRAKRQQEGPWWFCREGGGANTCLAGPAVVPNLPRHQASRHAARIAKTAESRKLRDIDRLLVGDYSARLKRLH